MASFTVFMCLANTPATKRPDEMLGLGIKLPGHPAPVWGGGGGRGVCQAMQL